MFLKEKKLNKSHNQIISKEPSNGEKFIMKKFKIKNTNSKDKDKRVLIGAKKFGLEKIISDKEELEVDVTLLQKTFNQKLTSNIDRKRHSGSTKSSQQESKRNLKIQNEEINTGQV
jgi:hypothetical protein